MVVTKTARELLVSLVDSCPDRGRFAEIEWCALNLAKLSRRNQRVADSSDMVGIEPQFMSENVPARSQVEVGVMRQVLDRVLVCGDVVIDPQFVAVVEGVSHDCGKGAGVAFFAVAADVSERQSGSAGLRNVFCIPNDLVESLVAAVKVIGAVVLRERVSVAVERKPSVRDAVSVTPDGSSEVGRAVRVPINVVVAEYDVFEFAVPISNVQRDESRAVVGERGFDSVAVPEDVLKYLLVVSCAKWLWRHTVTSLRSCMPMRGTS